MLKHSSLKLVSKAVSMKPLYSIAIAVLAMVVVLAPAYGAGNSLGALPNVGSYLAGVVQFFQNIISSLVQAINNHLPAF